MKTTTFLLIAIPLVLYISSCVQPLPPELVKTEVQPSYHTPSFEIKPVKKKAKDIGIKVVSILSSKPIKFSAKDIAIEITEGDNPLSRHFNIHIQSEETSAIDEAVRQSFIKAAEAILLNKGYRVTGFYGAYSMMPFKTKKEVDFVVNIGADVHPLIVNNEIRCDIRDEFIDVIDDYKKLFSVMDL